MKEGKEKPVGLIGIISISTIYTYFLALLKKSRSSNTLVVVNTLRAQILVSKIYCPLRGT